MLYGTLIFLHITACAVLITIVLIQSGRGGGLAQSFMGADSIFGTKTNAFLTRTTTVMAIVFFITCLSLALLSKQRSGSLIKENHTSKQATAAAKTEKPPEQTNQHIEKETPDKAPAVKAAPDPQQKTQETALPPMKQSDTQDKQP